MYLFAGVLFFLASVLFTWKAPVFSLKQKGIKES
jgi:hypothetical protein